MMKQVFLSLTLLGTILVGCKPTEPTSIATLNCSARELVGTFSIGRENAPFANESIHSGTTSFIGGESVSVTLDDLWTENNFHLTSIVPPRPKHDHNNLLLLSIDEDMQLKITWKIGSESLRDLRLKHLTEERKCTPIVIENSGIRTDFVVRSKQGPYASICDRSYLDPTNRFVNYGLVYSDDAASDCLVLISYGPGVYTKTIAVNLPKHLFTPGSNLNTLYLYVDQEKHRAILYKWNCTTRNPRIVAKEFLQTNRSEFTLIAELKTDSIANHFYKNNFCIPNLNDLDLSAP